MSDVCELASDALNRFGPSQRSFRTVNRKMLDLCEFLSSPKKFSVRRSGWRVKSWVSRGSSENWFEFIVTVQTTNEKSSQFKLIFLRRPSFNNIITKEMGCVKNKNFEIFWFGYRPSCDGRLSFPKISRTRVHPRGRPCAPFSYPDVPFPNTGM